MSEKDVKYAKELRKAYYKQKMKSRKESKREPVRWVNKGKMAEISKAFKRK